MTTIGSLLLLLVFVAALSGCATLTPGGGSARIPDVKESVDDIARMRRDPRPIDGSVLVFSGWADPGFLNGKLVRRIQRVTLDTEVTGRQFATAWTMDDCVRKAMDAIERVRPASHVPSEGPFEVSIVAHSMGGLVARNLARHLDRMDDPPARIRRIFTIGTPHRGARLASLPTLDPKVVAMRADSDFLAELDRELAEGRCPEIVAYTRTEDIIVGELNTAPRGGTVRIVPRPLLGFGHIQAASDPRILADIMRILRAEPPVLEGVDPETMQAPSTGDASAPSVD